MQKHAGYSRQLRFSNGARGNSGITSQILRGIAEGLCDVKNLKQ